MGEQQKVIDVSKFKIAAVIKAEDGKEYKIASPSFKQLEQFEELKRNGDDPAGIFKAFELLGLPIEVGKGLPVAALEEVAKHINPAGAAEKK